MQKILFSWLLIGMFSFGFYLNAEYEMTPRKKLSKAIAEGNLPQVRSLIESSLVGIDEPLEDDYSDMSTPLIEAASNAKISIIKYLIKKGASVECTSRYGETPLVKLIEVGRRLPYQQLVETVCFLIDSGADVNATERGAYSPLMAACKNTRCTKLVELLIDKGAFIDLQADDGNTAYLLSLRTNNLQASRLLESRGANKKITCQGMQPLSVLAKDGNLVMAKLLIDEGADVNAHDIDGGTPLINAVLGKQSAMIEFLIERGADINATTEQSMHIQIPENTRYISFSRRFVTFPKGSTALNFALTMGLNGIANLIIDLGGVIHHDVEYVENYWNPLGSLNSIEFPPFKSSKSYLDDSYRTGGGSSVSGSITFGDSGEMLSGCIGAKYLNRGDLPISTGGNVSNETKKDSEFSIKGRIISNDTMSTEPSKSLLLIGSPRHNSRD